MKNSTTSKTRRLVLGLFTEVMFPGGVQRVTFNMAAALTEYAHSHGMDCALLSLNDPQGFHKLTLNDTKFVIHGAGRSRTQFLLSALKMSSRAELVHINHPHLAPLGLVLRTLRPRIKYSVSTHGIDAWTRLPLFRRLGLRSADWITAPSQCTAGRLSKAQTIDPAKVIVIPWGIDLDSLRKKEAKQPVPRLPRGRILLTVTRLEASERYKRVEEVIAVMPEVVKAVPDTYYVIVGDGSERPRFERQAKELGISKHVVFTGICSDLALAQHYNACDIFIMLSSKEGFGLVFVEAMAFGKPVVATAEGSAPEVVADGETGILVNPDEPLQISAAIIRLLQDDTLRERMGAAAIARVDAKYSLPRFQQQFSAFLSGVANGRGMRSTSASDLPESV
jgi:phosphatidylinositol alpha-1,6-mannosyltransferase